MKAAILALFAAASLFAAPVRVLVVTGGRRT